MSVVRSSMKFPLPLLVTGLGLLCLGGSVATVATADTFKDDRVAYNNPKSLSSMEELVEENSHAGSIGEGDGDSGNDEDHFSPWLEHRASSAGNDDGGECPNGRFVLKHLCSWCYSNDDALTFSKERNARGRGFATNKNSVIYGSPRFRRDGEDCLMVDTAKIVTCTVNTGVCTTNGNRCKCRHSVDNGHLFYHEIDCN